MATFGIVIRNKRADNYYPVYIRVAHNGASSYIKTALIVSEKGLKKTYTKAGKEQITVSDARIVRECTAEIAKYVEKLNGVNSSKMTVQEVISFLSETGDVELSFTDFAKEYIIGMCKNGRSNSATNYDMAVKRLHEFVGKDKILFIDITSLLLTNWIDSMRDSSRKRNLYPTCIKTMFGAALLKYNDEDRDVIKIKRNPFAKVKIPANRPAPKKSADIDMLRAFFEAEAAEYVGKRYYAEKMCQDVCLMMFCLAGMNCADLYDLPKEALKDGIICYRRKKTRDKSSDGSYRELAVPDRLLPLIEKYKGEKHLFSFADKFSLPDNFTDVVGRGCKKICESAGISSLTPYAFRHSWATIAINQCGASMDDVAFALCHASAHSVTSMYVRPDYSRIDRLNEKVLEAVFGNML